MLRIIAAVALLALTGCSANHESSPSSFELAALSGNGGASEIQPYSGVSGHITGSAHFQVFAANGLGLRKLTFNAIRHADGSVSGQWNIVAGASIIHGDIDCLTILPGGEIARFSGVVTNALFTTFQVGTAFAIQVVDNDAGPDAASEVRAFRNAAPEVGRLFCETGEAPAEVEMMDMELGKIQIHVD